MSSVAGGRQPVRLAYGETGLIIEVDPECITVVTPVHHAGAADAAATLRGALQHPVAGPPLRDVVRPGQRIAVSLCDLTRPQPREAMVRFLDSVGRRVLESPPLMKLLTGIYKADEGGEILVEGEPIDVDSPREAQDLGINIIHQEFNLVPDLTVAQNI